MKAIVYKKYGSTDELYLTEIEKPSPKDNEVLVKVHTAAINSWDWDLVRGKPRIYRLLFGLFKPKYPVIGSDVAGTIESVGKNVNGLKPGDEVFGDVSGNGFGAFAEYSCAPVHLFAKKPAAMSFEEAAAIPQAGVLALQGLKHGKIEGKQILINGAGGGVGTFGIQMAKHWEAEVTAVDSAQKFELMRSLGADHLIDYKKENFTKNGLQYDFILDNIALHSMKDYKRSLKPRGCYMMIGGKVGSILQAVTLGLYYSKTGNKQLGILAHKPNKADLEELSKMYEAGTLKPVIDRIFPLSETAKAIQYLGEGKVKGKVVVKV